MASCIEAELGERLSSKADVEGGIPKVAFLSRSKRHVRNKKGDGEEEESF